MAWTAYSTDHPLSGAFDLFNLKERLKIHGWMVSGSGDGTSFSASSDLINTSGSGLGGLANATSWFRIIHPANEREFLFQKDTNASFNSRWNIHYSSDGVGFVSGSPSATIRPSAADEVLILTGNNNDWLENTLTIPVRSDMVIGDSDEGYSFFFQQREPATTDVVSCFGLDSVLNPHPSDPDPVVIITSNRDDETQFFNDRTGDLFFHSATIDRPGGKTWYYKNTGGGEERFAHIPLNTWIYDSTSDDAVDNFSNSPFNGRFDEFPAWWGKGKVRTGLGMLKGASRLFRIVSIAAGRGFPNEDNTRIFMGIVSIPWNSGSIFIK